MKPTSAALVLLGLLAACGGGNVLGPTNQLQVTNAADNFQWQASAMDNVQQTLTYTWQNSGTQANVDHSPSVSKGSAHLRIRDAADVQVYDGDLTVDGTFVTGTGTAGDWTIEVVLDGTTGTVNFRVQKRP